MKTLVVNAYLCWGCKTCEDTCSNMFREGALKGSSRINVVAKNRNERVPVVCLQCSDAACVEACMFGALNRNESTGAIVIDYNKCTRCLACLDACPFGNIILEKRGGTVVKCDLCGGDPECAKTCPSGTLVAK